MFSRLDWKFLFRANWAQIRCKRDSLETELKQFQRKKGDLPAWVEVLVDDPTPGENLYDVARSCVIGKEYEVIRVIGTRTTPLSVDRRRGPTATGRS